MTERKHYPLEELDLVALETDARDAINQWDGKMDAEHGLQLVAEVRRLQKLAAHWEEQRDCAAEEVEGWIATANQRGEEVSRLQAALHNIACHSKTNPEAKETAWVALGMRPRVSDGT